MSKKNKSQKSPTNALHILLKVLGILIPIALMYWIFFVKIPAQVSYEEVWATLTSLSFTENVLLLLGGIATIITYGWTSATVLPGISLKQGTESAVSGQLTSVVLPAPVDLAIRFSMYKSYGFSIEKSAVAVGLAGIARYFTVFVVPLFGLVALIITGQGANNYYLWLLIGSAVFIFALWLMRLILTSKKSAHKVGVYAQRLINRLLRIARKKQRADIGEKVVDFGDRVGSIAVDYFKSIALSNLTWGFSCYLVLLMALRFCGVDASVMSAAYVLLVTGCMLLLNAFPITPGGIGVTETILVTFIPFPNAQVQTAFMSALFLYRIYTWLLPMPVGAIAYGNWRRQQKG